MDGRSYDHTIRPQGLGAGGRSHPGWRVVISPVSPHENLALHSNISNHDPQYLGIGAAAFDYFAAPLATHQYPTIRQTWRFVSRSELTVSSAIPSALCEVPNSSCRVQQSFRRL
jgi:hypothetical protein